MAVSRRLRYEILRRDDHACRYCGARAPEVPLTVDHVVPTALGGSDAASNLVTACRDCNAGKAASAPDAPLVEDVEKDALRWRLAMETAADIRAAHRETIGHGVTVFDEAWESWTWESSKGPQHFERPPDWRDTIERFLELGLEPEFLDATVDKAMQKRGVRGRDGEFRYFCGICWSEISQRQQMANALIAREHVEGPESDA